MSANSDIIRCPACGAQNRVPLEKIDQGFAPVCGRCKAALSVGQSARPIVVTDATFDEVVGHSRLPVLLDLWASWCGPCRLIAPIIDQLAVEYENRVRFAKLNTDENQATAGRFNLSGIPTLLIFKEGREVDRIVGAVPRAEIVRRLELIAGVRQSR